MSGGARVVLAGILAGGAAGLAAAGGVVPSEAATPGAVCSSASDPGLASQMAGQITAALRGRQSAVGLAVSAPATGLTCELDASRQFDSASVVKATILAALLHRDDGRPDDYERAEATLMITESDNDAATDLWNDVGRTGMERFLRLADMTQTVPGTRAWGLTQITARDQLRLLHLLTTPNAVLDTAARSYELSLMSQVEPAQRWGVSAGAPAGSTVELKNGWLPRATLGWRINSIGCVSGTQPGYCLAVLTDDNPTMAYGVQTISDVAGVVNRDLNSALALAVPVPGTSARMLGPARLAGTAHAGSQPTTPPGKGGPGPGAATAGGDTSGPARGLPTSSPGTPLPGRTWLGIGAIAALAIITAMAVLLRRRRS